jgi:hypothetical protein
MCRQNQLRGWALACFGIGILLGLWLEGGFLTYVFGIGSVILGLCMAGKN